MVMALSGAAKSWKQRVDVLAALEQRESRYEALRPELRQLLKRQAGIEQRSGQLERLVRERMLLAELLAGVSEALPETVWLTKLEMDKRDEVRGLLEGRGHTFQDVTRFLDRLKGVAGMTGVKPLSTSVTTDPDTGRDVVVFAAQIWRTAPPPAPAPRPVTKPRRWSRQVPNGARRLEPCARRRQVRCRSAGRPPANRRRRACPRP